MPSCCARSTECGVNAQGRGGAAWWAIWGNLNGPGPWPVGKVWVVGGATVCEVRGSELVMLGPCQEGKELF